MIKRKKKTKADRVLAIVNLLKNERSTDQIQILKATATLLDLKDFRHRRDEDYRE